MRVSKGEAGFDTGWVLVGGTPVYYRSTPTSAQAPAILHIHGFAISGSYMLPTASRLSGFHNLVPDLPGFGRSPDPVAPNTIPRLADSAAAFLDEVGVDRATVVGNSLGCAILSALAERHPDRIDRVVMVSPAGGVHSRPLPRAIGQLVRDAPREPVSMATVAVPDYLHFGVADALRLFAAMTRFPALEALLEIDVPMLAVLGARDPLLPRASRVREVVSMLGPDVQVAVLRDAAHAINYSHPDELALLVRRFLADESVLAGPRETEHPGLSPIAMMTTGR